MGAEEIRKSYNITGGKDICTAECKSQGSTDRRAVPEIKKADFREEIHSFIHSFL